MAVFPSQQWIYYAKYWQQKTICLLCQMAKNKNSNNNKQSTWNTGIMPADHDISRWIRWPLADSMFSPSKHWWQYSWCDPLKKTNCPQFWRSIITMSSGLQLSLNMLWSADIIALFHMHCDTHHIIKKRDTKNN